MALSTSITVVTRSGLSTHDHYDVRNLFSVGVATFSNFKTGSTNVHNIGIEAAGINVLGGDTPIGSGSTIYDDGGARFSGVVTATSFHGSVLGDISQATGAAAGLGTALSQTQTDPLNKIYYTDKVLSISTTTTIDHPATANLAYTQYGDIKIEDGHDLIIKDGDDFKYDILGISTTKLIDNNFPNGLTATTGTFSGDITGNINNSTLLLKTGGSERLRIDSSGRVLIGTTDAGGGNADELTVATSGNSGITIRSGTSNTGNIFWSDATSGAAQYAGAIEFHHSDDSFNFNIANTKKLTLQNNGDILFGNYLGTTNQPRVFFLSDDGNFPDQSNKIGLRISNGANDASIRAYSNTNTWNHVKFYSTHSGSIVTSGSITQANGNSIAYNTSSDYRLKENEVAISDGITRLKQLKPYRFNWKTDTSTTVDGFLAHEVSGIVPEAITGQKDGIVTQSMIDAGEIDEPIGTPMYQQMDHSKLVPLLTAALQEAITKIETLESEVASLKAK